jgi:hypothetical protein
MQYAFLRRSPAHDADPWQCRTMLPAIAALAIAFAPVSASPPTVTGKFAYGSTLKCEPGSWSPDAVSFSYAWFVGGLQRATGQTWSPDASSVNYQAYCAVTATDAAGASATANSAAQQVTPGITSIKLATKKSQKKKLVIAGRVGPAAALPSAAAARNGTVVAYRVDKIGLYQLFGRYSVDKKGKFKMTLAKPDKIGTFTYKVNFNPPEPSLWQLNSTTIKIKLKRK